MMALVSRYLHSKYGDMFLVSIKLDFRGIYDSMCKNFTITCTGPIVIVLLSRFHTEL